MTYYTIGHDDNRRTPYAPTILNTEDAFLSNCSKCGRTRFNDSNRDLILLLEGKGKLPDFLSCGHYPLTLISERTLDVWRAAGITGYESFPVKLVNKQDEEICDVQYHNIIITGRAELDYKKMGVKIKKICSKCGAVEYNKETWEFGEAFMKENTYDGSDLFVTKYFERAPICTFKVLEIVYKNKLTNFAFGNFEEKFFYTAPDINMKELFKKPKGDSRLQ